METSAAKLSYTFLPVIAVKKKVNHQLLNYTYFFCVSEMAPAGTVTLSEMMATRPKVWSDVHVYTKLFTPDDSERGYFDPGLFHNTEEFSMSCNEQHKMLMQGFTFDKADSTIYCAQGVNNELTIDDMQQHEPGQLCYAITLMTPNITLTVGPKTSLSLLLQSGQFHVTTYMLTEELVAQLKHPQKERDRVLSQVNTNALDRLLSARDPRKRKASALNNLFEPYAPYRPCSPTTTPPPVLF
jgi:hypothetical protein